MCAPGSAHTLTAELLPAKWKGTLRAAHGCSSVMYAQGTSSQLDTRIRLIILLVFLRSYFFPSGSYRVSLDTVNTTSCEPQLSTTSTH